MSGRSRRKKATGPVTSSPEDFLVKTSVQPASAPASTPLGQVSGLNSDGWWIYYDPVSCWWKIRQGFLPLSASGEKSSNPHPLDGFSGSWPKSGMTRSGRAFRLPHLVPLTSDGESSSSPTLRASEWKEASSHGKGDLTLHGIVKNHPPTLTASAGDRGGRGELTHFVKCGKPRGPIAPTLTAQGFGAVDVERLLERRAECAEKHVNGNGFGLTLEQFLVLEEAGCSPTLTARDWRSGKASKRTMARNSRPLNEVVEHLPPTMPTLTVSSGNRGPRKTPDRSQHGHSVNLVDVTAHLSERGGGVLNPRFCEWYMAFPDGWCDLPSADSATP
jgi:hypothetical protein